MTVHKFYRKRIPFTTATLSKEQATEVTDISTGEANQTTSRPSTNSSHELATNIITF